jgi:hypothetical protein
MDKGHGYGGTIGIPIFDNSEKSRLAYWRQYSEPIPAELLKITGWLTNTPSRMVVSRIDGKDVSVRAGDDPPNVLFRLPADAAGKRDWEKYLHFLRLHQSRSSVVQKLVERETRRKVSLDEEVGNLWDALFEADETARFALKRAREASLGSDGEEVRSEIARARRAVARCRSIASSYRVSVRRLRLAEGAIEHDQENLGQVVYPGLWAEINAFLDMQCLNTASLASDEFRRHTRRDRERQPEPLEEVLGLGER